MDTENKTSSEEIINSPKVWQITAGLLAGFLVFTLLFEIKLTPRFGSFPETPKDISSGNLLPRVSSESFPFDDQVLPQKGVIIPVVWGDLGKQLIETGVIDQARIDSLHPSGTLTDEEKKLLFGESNQELIISEENSAFILNLFWALGLGNKNEILERGPMSDFDGESPANRAELLEKAGRFASTGGWRMAKGNTMDHYSAHSFIELTSSQQKMAEEISKSIFRPCCGNPTHFPDCNHGMAMLGLIQLMASQDIPEKEIYKTALAVNAFWFPNNYLTIAEYLDRQGTSWSEAEPREILGANYSAPQGYRRIAEEISPTGQRSGTSC